MVAADTGLIAEWVDDPIEDSVKNDFLLFVQRAWQKCVVPLFCCLCMPSS